MVPSPIPRCKKRRATQLQFTTMNRPGVSDFASLSPMCLIIILQFISHLPLFLLLSRMSLRQESSRDLQLENSCNISHCAILHAHSIQNNTLTDPSISHSPDAGFFKFVLTISTIWVLLYVSPINLLLKENAFVETHPGQVIMGSSQSIEHMWQSRDRMAILFYSVLAKVPITNLLN